MQMSVYCTILSWPECKVSTSIAEGKRVEDEGDETKKLSAFLNFKSEIVDISKGNNGTMEASTGNYNVLAKTTIDLTKKSEMQDNAR